MQLMRGDWSRKFLLFSALTTPCFLGYPEAAGAQEKKAKSNDQVLILGEALNYFYSNQYSKALPLFKDLSEKIETLDVMYWVGVSARKTGDYELAINKFKNILKEDPNQHRVRLELADALILDGKLDEAAKELEVVKQSSPPVSVLLSIENRLAAIKNKSKKSIWSAVFSQGYQWDGNISSGPGNDAISVIGGTLNLNNTQSELSANNWVTKLGVNFRYDPGKPLGLIWNTKTNIYNSITLDYSQFNYLMFDISTGPWWVTKDKIFKIPVGYTRSSYGNNHLANSFHVKPTFEQFFGNKYSVTTSYTYDSADFSESQVAGNDHKFHKLSVGPNLYLKKKKHIISSYVSFENNNAEIARNSYDTKSLTINYFAKIRPQIEFNLFLRAYERNYDAAPLLYAVNRRDHRQMATTSVTYRFKQNYFASVEYSHINNNSNAQLYDFNKNMLTFSVGINY